MEILLVILGFTALVALRIFALRANSLGKFEVRLRDAKKTSGRGKILHYKEVHARGLFPVTFPADLRLRVSVMDSTDKKMLPVLCSIEEFQAHSTPAYEAYTTMGHIEPGLGLKDWCPVAPVLTEVLHPPYGGTRNLTVRVYLEIPNIARHLHRLAHLKFLERETNPDLAFPVWTDTIIFRHHFTGKGYLERDKNRSEVAALTVQIAIGVALSDGHLHENEGQHIKRWIERTVARYSESPQQELKNACNAALRAAHTAGRNNTLNIHDLIARLNDIGEPKDRHAAFDLCTDVMVADGIADINELRLLHTIENELRLDPEKVEEIRDWKILELEDLNIDPTNGIEADYLLGIDPDWDPEIIKKHLRKKFDRWNGRITSLPMGKKHDNAQRMLDLIGEVRKKHAG